MNKPFLYFGMLLDITQNERRHKIVPCKYKFYESIEYRSFRSCLLQICPKLCYFIHEYAFLKPERSALLSVYFGWLVGLS